MHLHGAEKEERAKKKKNFKKSQLLSWCFEPSQPQGITSGLKFKRKKKGKEEKKERFNYTRIINNAQALRSRNAYYDIYKSAGVK